MKTYSRHMLETARRARDYIAAANDMIAEFVMSRQNPDGGFRGRAAESDLYYTAFALDCLAITGHPLPQTQLRPYLISQARRSLDLIHASCLARCLKHISDQSLDEPLREQITESIETYRAPGSGYRTALEQRSGTPYGCFLALTAYQELGMPFPAGADITACLEQTFVPGQGYGNEPGMLQGTVSATAAALMLQYVFNLPVNEVACAWLKKQQSKYGGFLSSPVAPGPDLLSTAVTLYILDIARISLGSRAGDCRDFVEGMWHESGGFRGFARDDQPDCEYTFYGLLALGCLQYEFCCYQKRS